MHYTVGEGGGAFRCGWDFWGPESTWELDSSAKEVGDLGQVHSSLYASFHGSTLLFTVFPPGWHQQVVTMYCELPKALSPSKTVTTNAGEAGRSSLRRAAEGVMGEDPPPHWPSSGPTGEA